MKSGLVSVMMPAYNAARYIEEAVQSVLDQSYPDWELLVVNDGSTDETAAIVGRFQDPRIRLFDKENGGESSARNMALDHARGELIAYLDADDAYLPHHLERTVGFLAEHPECDAVYTDGFHMDEEGRRLASLQSRRRGPFAGRLYEEVVRASDVFGPPMCVVLRHDLVARHGLRYDPRIVIGPDWDFFVCISDVATFGYLAEATGLYRVHRSNITAQVDSTRRAAFLAICREKAIAMPHFGTCSSETQVAVFYDLLVNLLGSRPGARAAAVASDAFEALPRAEQARLLRLTATEAILERTDRDDVRGWLERARSLDPSDRRTALLLALHRLGPGLCHAVLVCAKPSRAGGRRSSPFADLEGASAL